MEQRIKLIWQNSKKSNRIFIQNNELQGQIMHANAYSINLYCRLFPYPNILYRAYKIYEKQKQLVEKVQHMLGFLLFLWYNRSGDENVGKES